MKTLFFVRCTVWGGVTGHRTALLKKDGFVVSFDTAEAAEEEAAKCRAAISPYATASFAYEVIESPCNVKLEVRP